MAKAKKNESDEQRVTNYGTAGTPVIEVDPTIPPIPGPYLSAALIAESVLREAEGNKLSVIRIVDNIGIDAETIKTIHDEVVSFSLIVLVSFRAGGFRGEMDFVLVQVSPTGESEPIGISQFKFNGTASDTWEIKMPLNMKWHGAGQYWFEVHLGGKMFSRIPFEIEVADESKEKQGS